MRPLLVAVLTLCSLPLAAQPASPIVPGEARLWLGESVRAPDFTDAATVGFPDYWRLERRLQATAGWYQLRVEIPSHFGREGTPLALMVPNTSGLLEVYWDDEYLGGSVPLTGTGVPIVSGPLMMTVPRSLSTAGEHTVLMRFTGTAATINFVRGPVIGPEAELRKTFARKKLTLVYLPLVLGGFSVVSALIFLATYRRDPSARGVQYLTAGLVAASWSVLGLYVSFPEMMALVTDRLRPLMFHLSFVFFLFALNDIAERRGRFETVVMWITAFYALALLLVPQVRVYQVAVLWTPFTYSLGLWLFVRVLQLAAGPPRRWLIIAALSAVPLIIVHDITGVVRGGDYFADQVLSVFNPPLYAFALMMVLISRARMHLQTVLTLNEELEDRVAEKHAELQANYSRIAEAERREAVLNERERMVRDMHDGLGNQLVSTLALVESRRFDAEELEAALRDSLDDMRMMVHSLDRDETDLLEILALVRERVEPRLTRQGLKFRWRVEDVPGTTDLAPDVAGHVLRIVQESLTNVVKHAGAQTITLSTGVEMDRRFVAIADDGCGFASLTEGEGGRGLQNMRDRARQLGGELAIETGTDGGTRVTLWLDRKTEAQNAERTEG